ncbi:ABC transporter substrate-binding protein, partial [Candidatus Entotheonella palauensis]|uniref:ABC transporter substrate-binding protein n=1 Tax=Candidatus Entotheonella palauensis TaxID=93172 RepID=UPI0011778F4B
MQRWGIWLMVGLLSLTTAPALTRAEPEVSIRFGAFWAMSGLFKSFGVNSKAVYEAYMEKLNAKGGIKLKDGRTGRVETLFYDAACNAEQAISAVRKMAGQDNVLLAVGPTCSSALEPVFGILQKKLDDAGDTGLQFMVFSDTSAKPGLGTISPWGFRASPDESEMYKAVMQHLKALDMKTVAFGYEDDFAHSTGTYKVMRKHAEAAGLEVVSDQGWHFQDTEFSAQVR